ncbi:hypothetical protein DIRU0_C00364 [Diutina rugosa]
MSLLSECWKLSIHRRAFRLRWYCNTPSASITVQSKLPRSFAFRLAVPVVLHSKTTNNEGGLCCKQKKSTAPHVEIVTNLQECASLSWTRGKVQTTEYKSLDA